MSKNNVNVVLDQESIKSEALDIDDTNQDLVVNNTEVKLEFDPIEIDSIIKIEDDNNGENSISDENYDTDDNSFKIPLKNEITKKFENCINFLPKIRTDLVPQDYKKIDYFVKNLWELVKKSFIWIDNHIAVKSKKIRIYRLNIKSYQQKFRRLRPKFNQCIKFIDFIKKEKKFFTYEIKNYLKKHKILRLNQAKIDEELDNCVGIKKKVNEVFDKDATSDNQQNAMDVDSEEYSQEQKQMHLKINQVMSINVSQEDEPNLEINVFDDFNENLNAESDTDSDTNDDELFQITPEVNKNRQNYTKLDTGQYQCNICLKNSPNYSGFLQHTISHEEQTLLCHICGRNFATHKQCITHMTQCRKNICITGKRKLRSKGGSGMHSGIDFKNVEFPEYCPYKKCSKRFIGKNFKYYEHLDFHRGVKPYSCNTCTREFQFAYNLFAHLKTKSRCSLENCTLPEYTPDAKNYEEYIELATSHYKYICNTCSRKFETKFKVLEHQNSHTGEKPYLCICGCSYNTYANLCCHVKKSLCNIDLGKFPGYFEISRMGNEGIKRRDKKLLPEMYSLDTKNIRQKKKYICIECDNLELGTYMRLKTHRQSKHMEKTFECDECHKKFPTLCVLKTHLRKIHIGAYKCDICKPDKSMTYSQYSFHNKFFHNKNNLGCYQCRVCELQFETNVELIKHVNEAWHTSARGNLYFCPICNEKYKYLEFYKHLSETTHSELVTNWKKKFNINELICFYCNEQIDSMLEYLKHLDIKHHESNFENNLLRLVHDAPPSSIDLPPSSIDLPLDD